MFLLKPFVKIKALLLEQLEQGMSPEKLAYTFSLTLVIAICPIIGITTTLGVIVGYIWKLNHPIIQGLNYVLYPLQLILIPPFIMGGDRLFGSGLFEFTLVQAFKDFGQSKSDFFVKYGKLGLMAFGLWAMLAPFLIAILYLILKPIFLRIRIHFYNDEL